MALEDAIQNLADAINGYTAAISKPTPTDAPEVKKAATSVKADTPASTTKPAGTEVSDTKKTSSAPSASEPKDTTSESADTVATTTSPSEEVDVKVLQEKFATLIDVNLDKAKEVLTELGFPKLKLVPANLHAKALALTEAALNG